MLRKIATGILSVVAGFLVLVFLPPSIQFFWRAVLAIVVSMFIILWRHLGRDVPRRYNPGVEHFPVIIPEDDDWDKRR